MALSELKFYGKPELTARSEVYDLQIRPSCGNKLLTGSFYGAARNPTHGANALTIGSTVDYFIYQTGRADFSSSMEGSHIRLKNISIQSVPYTTVSGAPAKFSGLLTIDFVTKVKKVVNAQTLQIEDPFSVSSYVFTNTVRAEDSPYFENTQVDTEKFDGFNETIDYVQKGIFSGTEAELKSQVYNSRPSFRNNGIVSNIQSGQFEIIHTPRVDGVNFSSSTKKKCLVNLTLSNLRATSGSLGYYKVFQTSWNVPVHPVCVAEGRIVSNQLLVSVSSSNADYRHMGKFYNPTQITNYWLSTGSLSASWAPSILIDSITISSSAGANSSETSYIMMKDNTAESNRVPAYVPTSYQTGSFWYTDAALFMNSVSEPNSSYLCVVGDPILSNYSSSIEVNRTGSIYNSNSVRLIKNTMYEFSIDYSGISYSSKDNYEFIIYYVSTDTNQTVNYLRVGELNSKTTRGFLNGTYTNRFLATKTSYGTLKLVPKYLNFITVSNLSLKAFYDEQYSIDSLSVRFPVSPSVQNERVEFSIDLFDTSGSLVTGDTV